MTKKLVNPRYSQRVSPLQVARTSTYLRTRRFPSADVSFSFEKKTVLSLPTSAAETVNTIFLSSEMPASSLAKPVHESVPLVTQRFDSRSKHVTKHTRLKCDDDARSSQARSPNLNTRNCDSSSPSQVSGQKNPAQRPLISHCRRRRDKLCTATLPWRWKIGT